MAFESGRISCRMFISPRALPDEALGSFARNAAPAINGSSITSYQGWVTGRHLLDRHIVEETAYYGGFLRLALLNAERKVPPALLHAESQMEELAQMAAEDVTSLSQKKRRAIRQSVMERLLPKMPPRLQGIPLLYDENTLTVYSGAVSVPQMDLFSVYFSHTLDFNLTPYLPETLAAWRKKVDVKEWAPTSFSPEVSDERVDEQPGRDFLTWLWFAGEARGGSILLPDAGPVSILLEGPLTFVLEGDGAHEIVLRRGEPLYSTEAKACLLAGKKLRRARLTVAQGDESWETNLDADEFTFRSLRLPASDALDPVTRFQDRMNFLDRFRVLFLGLYDAFVEERSEPSRWRATQKEIHEWVRTRSERK